MKTMEIKEGQVCVSNDNLNYYNDDMSAKTLYKGAKLTYVRSMGDKHILRWGTKIFILGDEEFAQC